MYGGTFRWTETKDKILLGEAGVVEPYQFKAGSKESGQGLSEVAGAVNQYDGFKVTFRDQRCLRTSMTTSMNALPRSAQLWDDCVKVIEQGEVPP